MTWLVSLLAFSLPSLFVRAFFRKDFRWIGLFQDLFAGAQLGCLAWVAPWVVPVFQLFVFYDGWIDRKNHFRMDGSSLAFLFQLGEFRDSAKALRIAPLFPLFLLGSAPSVFLSPLPIYCLLLALPLLICRTDSAGDQLFLLWEKQGINCLLRPFRKGKVGFLPFVQKEVLSKSEKYTSKSGECPLFRYTHGFRGEKGIDVVVGSGEKPHVMFLFVESFRAKEFGALGSKRGVTPHMDRLAKESHLFPNFYANSFPTFRSFFTSFYGLPYCLEMKTNLDKNLSAYGLPELMQAQGYQTNFFTGADWGVGGIGSFLRRMEADAVFDKREIEAFNPKAEGGSWGIHDEYLFEMTLDHFEKVKETPQFYSLLTITSHHPWIVPNNFPAISVEKTLEPSYQNYLKTLHYTDHQVERFIQKLKERGLTKDLILFIMGDHGISFGEHIEKEEGNELFHVPLMIYAEGRIRHPTVMKERASQCDLLPTVMDMLSFSGHQHSVGRSLLRKEKNPRVLFHNSFKVTGALRCLDESGEGEYNKVTGKFTGAHQEMAPFLTRFEEMLSSLYDKNRIIPKGYQKKGKNLSIEPCKFLPSLTREELYEAILQKSPMVHLILPENSHLSRDFLSMVAKHNPNLDTLNLQGSFSVTDEALTEVIKGCKSLYDLRIANCYLLSEKCLPHLPKGLMTLNLHGLDFVSDEHFVHPLKYLEKLNIRHTSLTAEGLRRFPFLFPTLSCLSLSYNHMTIDAILGLIDQIPLRFLSISEGEELTDEEALQLFKKHHSLRHLQFANCSKLTDALFHQIEESGITELYLNGVPHLTDKGMEDILKLPLTTLHIDGAPNLTSKIFDLLDQHRSRFDDLSIRIINK